MLIAEYVCILDFVGWEFVYSEKWCYACCQLGHQEWQLYMQSDAAVDK
jgi:hypothetical protein